MDIIYVYNIYYVYNSYILFCIEFRISRRKSMGSTNYKYATELKQLLNDHDMPLQQLLSSISSKRTSKLATSLYIYG